MEFLSQSEQHPSKLSNNLNLNRKPSYNSLRSFLPKLLRLLVKEFYWLDVFDNYLHEVCDQFDNMVVSGDLNLPDILWDSIDSALGVNELAFIETLHDHLLTQLNKRPTRGNSILELVITSVPNRVNVTDILSLKDTGFFFYHSVIIFQFNAFIKAPQKTLRFVYDYAKGDFRGLSTINLFSIIATDGINTDWHKGRNPIPWMSGSILNLIKKIESIRQKLKLSPSSHLMEKLTVCNCLLAVFFIRL